MDINYENYDGRFVGVTKAADTLGVSRPTIYQLIEDQELPRTEKGIPAIEVNRVRLERIRLAQQEVDRLRDIPELKEA